MISTRTIGVLTAAGAVATAVAAPALVGTAAASRTQSFTVHAHGLKQSSIDVGDKGFSAGDYDVHTDRLMRNGHKVGWDSATCLVTRLAKTADESCHWVMHLRHGQIVADGVVRSGQQGPGTFTLAITGGTGRYDDARGSLSITATSGNTVPITVNVRY